MRNIFTISVVWNKKGETRKDGTAPIFICVYADGKRKYYNTKICVCGEDWDTKKQIIKKSVPNAIAKNKKLSEIRATIEKHCFKLAEKETFNLNDCFLCFDSVCNDDFYLFVENLIKADQTKTTGTLNNRLCVLRCLKKFRANVKFSNLNYTFVESFKNWLYGENYKETTIAVYLRVLKMWLYNAHKKELIKKNPFDGVAIAHPVTERAFLTETEFKTIESTNFKNHTLQYCKDVFCFGVYTGLRISDIMTLTPKNIIIDGENVTIVKEMVKLKSQLKVTLPISILFGGKAVKLLEKYQNGNGFYFAKYCKETIYHSIKLIAKTLGINKNISIHTARHTFATILLNKNVPLVNVSKLLGHTNISTTQIYAKLLDDTVNDNLKLIQW
ncbi:MAG: site-specific integrase [Bacteroidales bacterium]|nr:site-specific integrase [Bacteroidales bacterium]